MCSLNSLNKPGSGVNENNVADLVAFTGATEVHSSARSPVKSEMAYKNEYITMGTTGDEYSYDVTDVERVRKIIENANR